MVEINDINDSRIAFYKSLRYTPKIHTDNRAFIAEEEKVVFKLLHSNLEIISIFATTEYYNKYSELIKRKNIPADQIFYADKNLMKEIVGYRLHSGFLAIGRQPENVFLDNLQTPIIILNSVVNAENVGSIVRNMAAFGFRSIIYDENSVTPYLRRAVRVSIGNVFNIDVHYSSSLLNTLSQLKRQSARIIGAEITDNSIPFTELELKDRNYCIIFGSEGKGLQSDILKKCDDIMHIPMRSDAQSLNVASSSAIMLYYLSNLKS